MYRFTLTPRLALIAAACLLGLMLLLFLLGVEIGRQMATPAPSETTPAATFRPAGELPATVKAPEMPKIPELPSPPAPAPSAPR